MTPPPVGISIQADLLQEVVVATVGDRHIALSLADAFQMAAQLTDCCQALLNQLKQPARPQ